MTNFAMIEYNDSLYTSSGEGLGYFLQDKLSGWYSLLAFDKPLRSTVAMASPFREDKSIQVHVFIPDDTAHEYRVVDCIITSASLLKLVEVVTLFHMGSAYL